jgi:putative PIN family toxin of toxin-antitoxin system
MRVVLDTNLLISGIITPKGTPAKIVDAWHDELFELVVTEEILDEVERVLAYSKIRKYHRWSDKEIDEFITGLRVFGFLAKPEPLPGVPVRDPDDLKFLECAVGGEADCVVTGDKDLLSIVEIWGIRILRPTEFLRLLKKP